MNVTPQATHQITQPTHQITLPNGDCYAIPDHFFADLYYAAFLDDVLNPKTPNLELAAAIGAVALVKNLEATHSVPQDRALPPAFDAAIDTVLQTRQHQCSLSDFADRVVLDAVHAQRRAMTAAWKESYQLEWQRFARDWWSDKAHYIYPVPDTWIAPSARMALAYRELRNTYTPNEIASAVASAMHKDLVRENAFWPE